jgi:hypothetical protein
MPKNIYIHGHGIWKPDFGYTVVPQKCSVTLTHILPNC